MRCGDCCIFKICDLYHIVKIYDISKIYMIDVDKNNNNKDRTSEFIQYLLDFPNLELSLDDFKKRKRIFKKSKIQQKNKVQNKPIDK